MARSRGCTENLVAGSSPAPRPRSASLALAALASLTTPILATPASTGATISTGATVAAHVAVLVGSGGGPGVQPPDAAAQALAIDQLLSIESVVSGAPEWSPEGSEILVQSALTGGLTTISPDGGFPARIPVEMGSSGHFLASQMPGWSPSASWISYVSDKSGTPEVWLWSTADGTERRLTSLGARINSMSWSPDERWIAFAGDRYGNFDIWTAEVATGRVQRLTTDERYDVFPTWTPDARRILYVRLDHAWEDHEIIAIDADGGNPQTILTDTDFFDYRAGGTFGYPQLSPDGRHVLFRSHRSGWINYWIAPMVEAPSSQTGPSGNVGEPRQIAPAEADQSTAKWSPDGRWIAYTENHNGHHDLRVVPADGGEPRVLVSLDEGVVSAPSWSPGSDALAYFAEGLTKPKDLFTVSVDDGTTRQLTHSMPAGGFEDRLVVPEKVRYASTDGHEIPAYLYRTPAASGARRPGVLWIHGGPTSQFNDTFQQHVQFFAQRGYVVLLPNIRGSSGYGKSFADANNGCWGHCDLEDVIAGGEYLKTLPDVDPERIGITGNSYGGVMTMYAVAFAPGYFRAGIASSGYADWVHFYHGENELRHIKLLEHELGPFATSGDVWRRSSSITDVAKVATPLFMVHGVGRYPGSDQSELFARALENHYKPFRYTTYPNENYYVYGKANRRKMLADMLDFFDQFLKDEMTTKDGGG